ncbi:hypothetical protein [Nocardia nova]|uniref:hypothetical protein n=1 Tax=Nocardia nova TaxID=37330 RepID=UPI000CEA49A0|nr:hypothetical protein [Nocardia nova]PPJ33539.1 hypothetical protein C5E41_02910 [Nocardia nova]
MVAQPGTATSTCFMSPRVAKIVGTPISTTTAITAAATDHDASAHGAATQAISSVAARAMAGPRPCSVRFGETSARSDMSLSLARPPPARTTNAVRLPQPGVRAPGNMTGLIR